MPTTSPTADIDTVLCQAEANLLASRQVGFERLRIARDWALLHPPDPAQLARNPLCARSVGAGELLVLSHVEAELAAALEISPLAALRLMGDAVDLDRRLPLTWAATADSRLEAWVARKIADLTAVLSADQTAWVDAQIADLLGTLSPGRLLRIVEARVKEADQELADRLAADRARSRGVWFGRDNDHGSRGLFARGDAAELTRLEGILGHLAHLLRLNCPELVEETMDQLRARALGLLANPLAALKLLIGAGEDVAPEIVAESIRQTPAEKSRPRTMLYVHLTPATLEGEGVARAEELGALTRQQLIDLLGHENITLRPVIDLNENIAADCYEVPPQISEQLHLARPADCFPYAQSVSRKQDQDHTRPYQPHGPPGQTRLANLGHLVRRHHRVKTFAGWRVWQQDGQFTWITPHGRIYITDAKGTHRVEIYQAGSAIQQWMSEYVLAS